MSAARRSEGRLGRLAVLVLGVGLGVLLAAIGLPMVRGGGTAHAIPGLRGRAALLDPAALAEIDRLVGRDLLATGGVVLALAVVLFVRHVRPTRAALAVVGATFLLVQAVSWHGRWLAEQLAAR